MATDVQIRLLCDLCMAEDIREDARTRTWQTDGSIYSIDLCESHGTVFDEAEAILEAHGRRVKRPHRAGQKHVDGDDGGRVECPVCGKALSSRGSLQSHLRSQHNQSIAEAEGRELTHVCEECGRRFNRSQALGLHRRQAHGIPGPNSKPAPSRTDA